jgi:hypothetical protein
VCSTTSEPRTRVTASLGVLRRDILLLTLYRE